MKRENANLITVVIGVLLVCLFSVNPSFSQDEGLSEALDALESSTQKHTEVLTDLLGKVPQEAKASIEHAIAVSQRGRNMAVEAVELALTSDPLRKASLRTMYAERRLAEIQAMRSKGNPEFIETLTKDYEGAINAALGDIVKAQSQARDVSEALNAVERSTKKHTEILTGLLEEVPEQAKPAITHAIEVSKRGRNRALDVLNRIQKGELPIGKPEGVGKLEKPGRPSKPGIPERPSKPQNIEKPGRPERPERGPHR